MTSELDSDHYEDLPEYTEADFNCAILETLHSPTFFCENVLNLKPFSYQVPLLEDQSKRIVVCAGRRTGKSLICSAKGLWYAFANPKSSILIVSATQRQSSLMFDNIAGFVEESALLRESVTRNTRTLMRFTNGSQINALPCGHHGYFLRGMNAHLVIVDEANFVPEEVIKEVINPMLATTSGTSILISTPFDRQHYFYKAFNNPKYSRYHFKSLDSPLVSPEFLLEQREEIGDFGYRREYEAEFVDDDRTYFPTELLRSCVHVCDLKQGPCSYCNFLSGKVEKPCGELFAGYDVGGLADPAALVVIERNRIVDPNDPNRRKTVYRVVLEKTFLDSTRKKLGTGLEKIDDQKDQDRYDVYTKFTLQVAEVHKKLGFQRLLVDSTGNGSPIVSHCRDLKLPASGLVFSQKAKEDILTNLRLALEGRRIVLPDWIDLLASLNCIVADRSRTGSYSFDHLRGTHDDLAYALALALWVATQNSGTVIMMKDEPVSDTPSWRSIRGLE